ncbi:MAG: hypothetical protein ACYDD4_04410 [Acidimicrobiales bacterium]
MRRWIIGAMVLSAVSTVLPSLSADASSATRSSSGDSGVFQVGAASADITPPALSTPAGRALDAAEFVPLCGTSPAQLAKIWTGPRLFAFTDPYVDRFHAGQYVPGDPYCDPTHSGRYQAPYLAGGSSANRWPTTSADTDPASNAGKTVPTTAYPSDAAVQSYFANDPISAQAVVFRLGSRHIAVVTVNSIGLFNTTMDQIRAAVRKADPAVTSVFVSSTHNESSPDPIGLWGPDVSGDPSPVNQVNGDLPAGATSGVDEGYMSFLVKRVAQAIVSADEHAVPGELKVATARMPADTQTCWSSYPFIDDQLVPVLQGVALGSGGVPGAPIFTLVDVGTHDETLGFSGDPRYTSMLSGDWTGELSQILAAQGDGVGMEMAALVGSDETPALYPGAQVLNVPGALHNVSGSPVDACRTVYPEPAGVQPDTDALKFIDDYASSVAQVTEAALASPQSTFVPSTVEGQTKALCLQLQNNYFAAAFALGLFPDRPAYADPRCTVGLTTSGSPSVSTGSGLASVTAAPPAYLRSEVGVVTLGPQVQIAYSPGEVFPFTEIGGPVDAAQMPFPTNCYEPSTSSPTDGPAGNFTCGSPLSMTPMVSARMTTPFRFLAGLGEDMVGYIFPPGNFVGSQGQSLVPPWSVYEDTSSSSHDRFGYGHSDDSESVGPNVGPAVTAALDSLLSADGRGTTVVPGLYVDSAGRLCDSPFPAAAPQDTGDASGSWITGCSGFGGAAGVEIVQPHSAPCTIAMAGMTIASSSVHPCAGFDTAQGWATYLATADSGTAGTAYPYSVDTRGVMVNGGPMLIDVFSGAQALGLG